MKKQRYIPMPTEEEKARARLKLAKADPLVWAMKSVDDRFPDEREKSVETIKAEVEVTKRMAPAPDATEVAAVEESKVPVDVEEVEDLESAEVEDDENMLDDSDLLDDDDDMLDDEDMLDDSDLLDQSEILDEPEEATNTEMIDALSNARKSRKNEKAKVPEVLDELGSEMKVEASEKEQTKTDSKKGSQSIEIKAEDKTAVPMGEGVMTMEVTPMRQDVSNVSPEEVKAKAHKSEAPESESQSESNTKEEQIKVVNNNDGKMQVKLTSLESKQKKMTVGIVALVALALGGVLFGIIATIRQDRAVEELVNQIAVSETTSDSNVDDEYVYIKDWGLKIKIVAGLNNISYNMLMDDYAEVQIWGSKRDSGANYVPDFAKQNRNGNPLGTVVRVPRYERAAAGRLIWYDDYYNYYYQGPSGVPTVSEDEMSWWVESYLLIKEMLTNADNYMSLSDSTIGQQ